MNDGRHAPKKPVHGTLESLGVTLLLMGAMGVLLYFAHSAFVPIALALLFALVLSGPVERLHRLRIPRNLSAVLLLSVVLGAVALMSNLMWAPAQQWYAAAPQTMKTVRQKLMPVAHAMSRFNALRLSASSITAPSVISPPNARAAAEAPVSESAPVILLSATREYVVSTVTFVIVTLFLLSGGPPMLARLTAAFVDDLNATHVLHIIGQVRHEVGRFYVTTAMINIGLGCATAAVMSAWGMPTPLLWGVVAAVSNFVPYAGATATLLLVTVVAFVSFDTLTPVLGVAASYIALATIEGQIVQPHVVGRRLALNPMLVFLALWFGGLFWGIAGIVLAMPTLLTLKVVAENRADGALKNFLGPNEKPPRRR